MDIKKIEQIEVDALLDAVSRCYGYDFRNYAGASFKRRLKYCLEKNNYKHISEMIPRLLYDKLFFKEFLLNISVTVTEMFRDPDFYNRFKEKVLPVLKTYPFIKIWHAGCATGEEVYSMAILLHEAGFLDRAQIYATDFNQKALQIAREGIYPLDRLKEYIANYNKFDGASSFSTYYHAKYNAAKMRSFLKENIIFANHNLVTDKVFGEMNVVICRNVLIYFDRVLQDRVLSLFRDSLCHRGFLCLGNKESILQTVIEQEFEGVSRKEKIFRKKS